MKQKKLLLRCVDDSVIILSFVLDDDHNIKREGTKEEIDAEIIRASVEFSSERLPIVSWEEIENEDVLIDRTFRNAWKHTGEKGFNVDILKAREIHREYLRVLRNPLLWQLDAEYMKADETVDIKKKKEIAYKKQVLRDITAHREIELAKTPEELKIVGLAELDALR